jgi:hypothetical protein
MPKSGYEMSSTEIPNGQTETIAAIVHTSFDSMSRNGCRYAITLDAQTSWKTKPNSAQNITPKTKEDTMQASPLPVYTQNVRIAAFPALPLTLLWKRLLTVHCPALRLTIIEGRDSRHRKTWELEATDRRQDEPAEDEQWQRAFQLLADSAVGWLASQLLTAEQRKAELEQMALDIRQECECTLRNLEDTGQTHRIMDLLTAARIVLPNQSEKICQIGK